MDFDELLFFFFLMSDAELSSGASNDFPFFFWDG